MIRAVIFDMDGLMIDSARMAYEGYVVECAKLGLTMDRGFYQTVMGTTVAVAAQKFYDRFGSSFPLGELVDTVLSHMDDRFEKEGVPLKKGLKELLTYLKANGYKTVVATSSTRDRVDKILQMAGLTGYFDDLICGDEVEKGKPDPEVFLRACQKAGVQPQDALVLEDSEAGIQAAFSAGIPVICVPDMKYPQKEDEEKTDMIVDSLLDVLELLQRIDMQAAKSRPRKEK